MNVNPSVAAASIAGVNRAAVKGSESDNQATDARSKQAASEAPAGKNGETQQLDAGDQSGDRDANGRQLLDVFERSEDESEDESDRAAATSDEQQRSQKQPSEGHLDLEA